MRGFLVLASITVATPAQAAPVFLTCTLVDRAGASAFDVQVNEEAGKVDYFARRTKMAISNRAIFTPEEVRFNSFVINRIDLSFRRENDATDQRLFGWPEADEGSCEKAVEKRAF